MSRKLASLFLALVLTLTLLAGCGANKEEEKLYFFNYGDYMDPEVLEQFKEETGITVIQDFFDTNESMYPIIAAGQVQYDLVMASDYMVEKLISHDLIQTLDKNNIPNMKNLNEKHMELLETVDPGNQYCVPYTLGLVAILYNTTMIPEGSVTKWTDLWDPAYEQYGILMQDSIRDTFMVAEEILGYDINSTDEAELQKVVELLKEQQPRVAGWKNDEARDDLITGEAGIGMVYSGEYLYCKGENEDLTLAIPEEGTNACFDCFVIPKNAKNKTAAEKFINYILEAEVGKQIFDYLTYPTPNQAAAALIDEEIRNDPSVFPTDEILSRCGLYRSLGDEGDDLLATYWKRYREN